MNRKTTVWSRIARGVVAIASAVSLVWQSPVTAALAAPGAVVAASTRNAEARFCSNQPAAQPSALLSSLVTTTLPFVSANLPAAGSPVSALTPAPTAVATPSELPPEVVESMATMQALPRIDLRWQATFLAPVGSGWLVLSPPDAVDGWGSLAGTSWKLTTNADRTAVQVGDRAVGDLPAAGLAAVVRDLLVSLPCYLPNASVRRVGGMDLVEGRLMPGSGSDLVRQVTGLILPGNPIGQVSLAIDPVSKDWRALDLQLVWAIVDVEVLGQRITWGPSGRISLSFGDDTLPTTVQSEALARISPSSAELGLAQLRQVSVLQPVTGPARVAVAFLDVRQLRAMLAQEPVVRTAATTAWQRDGEHTTSYADAVQRYRGWEEGAPLVGPFLRYVFRAGAGGS